MDSSPEWYWRVSLAINCFLALISTPFAAAIATSPEKFECMALNFKIVALAEFVLELFEVLRKGYAGDPIAHGADKMVVMRTVNRCLKSPYAILKINTEGDAFRDQKLDFAIDRCFFP
jgi:hypothetical protein